MINETSKKTYIMDISKTNDSSVSQGKNLILKIPTVFVNVPLKSTTLLST